MPEIDASAAGTGTGAIPAAGGVVVPSLAGTSPRRYRRRLANLRNVRTALADVVDALEAGTRDPSVARAIVYTLATMVAVFREEREARVATVIEERLARLEAAAGPVSTGRPAP